MTKLRSKPDPHIVGSRFNNINIRAANSRKLIANQYIVRPYLRDRALLNTYIILAVVNECFHIPIISYFKK